MTQPFSLIPSSAAPANEGVSRAEGTAFRSPPHNYEAEHAILGAILVNNRNYEKVSEFLRPEQFVNPIHGRIFEVCGRLIDKGSQADPVTVKGFLEQDGALGEVGHLLGGHNLVW